MGFYEGNELGGIPPFDAGKDAPEVNESRADIRPIGEPGIIRNTGTKIIHNLGNQGEYGESIFLPKIGDLKRRTQERIGQTSPTETPGLADFADRLRVRLEQPDAELSQHDWVDKPIIGGPSASEQFDRLRDEVAGRADAIVGRTPESDIPPITDPFLEKAEGRLDVDEAAHGRLGKLEETIGRAKGYVLELATEHPDDPDAVALKDSFDQTYPDISTRIARRTNDIEQ